MGHVGGKSERDSPSLCSVKGRVTLKFRKERSWMTWK